MVAKKRGGGKGREREKDKEQISIDFLHLPPVSSCECPHSVFHFNSDVSSITCCMDSVQDRIAMVAFKSSSTLVNVTELCHISTYS